MYPLTASRSAIHSRDAVLVIDRHPKYEYCKAAGRMNVIHHRNDGLSAFQSGSWSNGSFGRKEPLKAEKLEPLLVE
jgi:hypothetical protein